MGTAAFDALWGDEKPAKSSARPQGFDAMWDAAGPTYRAGHSKFTPTQLQARADRAVAQSEDELDAEPGWVERFAAHVLNTGQGIPGGEFVEAAGGAVGSRLTNQPLDYRASLATLRDRTQPIGGMVSGAEKMAGAALAIPALAYQGPLATAAAGPTMQGARYGVLSGLLQADPNRTVAARLHDAALEGGAGMAAGATVAGGIAGLGALRSLANNPNKAQALGSLLRLLSGHGLSGRIATGVLDELASPAATEAATAVPTAVEATAPVVVQVAPELAASASPAGQALQRLLQNALDEGAPGEMVKGYPISGDPPPASAEMLRRLEEGLLRLKRARP